MGLPAMVDLVLDQMGQQPVQPLKLYPGPAVHGNGSLAPDRPATAEPAGTGESRFTGLRFPFGPRFGYEGGTLVEHGSPPGPFRVPMPPLDVQIEARDIVFSLHSGQAKTDWPRTAA